MKIILAFLILVLFGCKNDCPDIYGIWYYMNEDEYGELWLDADHKALSINDVVYSVSLYDVTTKGDSLLFYPIGSDYLEFWLSVNKCTKNRLLLESKSGHEFMHYRIQGSKEVKIDTSEYFIDSVYDEFRDRLDSVRNGTFPK